MTTQLRLAPSGPPVGGQLQPVNVGPGMQIRQVEAGVSSGGLTLTTTYQQYSTLEVALDNVKDFYYYSATMQCEGHSLTTTGGAAQVQIRGSYDDFATDFVMAELAQNVGGVAANGIPDRPVGAHAVMKLGNALATPVPATGTATLKVRAYAKSGVANAVFLAGNQGDPTGWLRLQEYAGPSASA